MIAVSRPAHEAATDEFLADKRSRIEAAAGALGACFMAEEKNHGKINPKAEARQEAHPESAPAGGAADYNEAMIQVLEGVEHVRKRPGMYIGDTTPRGLHHLVYEIVDNSIDEAGAGFCHSILVKINADSSCSVVDDGRGIPVGIHPKEGIPTVEVVFAKLGAGGKFEHTAGSAYKVSGGLHCVGASADNTLSQWLGVEVRRAGTVHHMQNQSGPQSSDLQDIASRSQT